MKISIFLIFLFTGIAFSQSFVIQQVDSSFPLKKSPNKKIKLVKSNEIDRRSKIVPLRDLRDQVFSEAGVNDDVVKMDQFDRDMLYIRSKGYHLSKLSKLYPNIDKNKLIKLKEKVR